MNVAVLLVEPAAFAAALAVLRVPVPKLRRASPPALAAVAVLSAAGAVAAGASPTGWAALDIVLAAALGAAAVAAGMAASTPLMLVAAVVAAVAGIGSLALPLALAAIGLLLASLLIEVEPLLDATAAALVVQAALRLTSPGGTGLTALVAAAIVVALFASAGRTMDGRQRRTTVRVLAATGGFLVAAALLGAAASFTAVEPLRRGLAVATTVDAAGALDEPDTRARLEGAGREFAKARRSLDSWWARPVAAVPVAAQHWRVLRAAAVTGDELVAAGRRALDAPALDDVRVAGGRVPLQQLAAAEPAVADVAARATAARRRLDAARSAWLLPALATELHDNLARVREIERTTQLVNRALPLVPALVGGEGPRRYFLALQTPVEARGGGVEGPPAGRHQLVAGDGGGPQHPPVLGRHRHGRHRPG
ncbi:MAG TPA: hypothetical protein VM390_10005, partial [Acidimicrobiales bacterium]|nr:hypothetical protein [Acidimicrobiales bacterium]